MLTIDKAKVDKIIDELTGDNGLTASPEVWYGLYQIKHLPTTEIVTCKDCKHKYIENHIWHCPFGLIGGENFFVVMVDWRMCFGLRTPERRIE